MTRWNAQGLTAMRPVVLAAALVSCGWLWPAFGAVITVSNTNNSGAGSLRAAMTAANSTAAHDLINATGVSGTINLTSPLPSISANVSIAGPGAASLTIHGGGSGPVLVMGGGTTVEIDDVTLTSGTSAVGAIYNVGTLTMTNCDLSSNTGTDLGGAIFNDGTLTVDNCAFTGNSATVAGGAIYNNGGDTLTVLGSRFTSNVSKFGGAIFNDQGIVTITDSTFTVNTASDTGGGLYSFNGTATVSRNTFSGNSATQNSGGAIVCLSGAMTLANNTISANSAGGGGAGLVASVGAAVPVVSMTNCTITGNTTGTGGGVLVLGASSVTLGNTIVAGNTAGAGGPDVKGTVTSNGYNLIGDGTASAGFGATGDQVGSGGSPIDPLLGALLNNGGPTLTHALLAGSPATNAGSNTLSTGAGLTTDQRGEVRIANGVVDIGAFEVAFDLLDAATTLRDNFNSLDGNGNGLSLTEAQSGVPLLSWQAFDLLDMDNNNVVTLEELIEASVGPAGVATNVWVDFAHTGAELGTHPSPFDTLAEGATYVATGYTVTIQAGSTSETGIFSKAMILQSNGGAVRIGTPCSCKLPLI